MSVLTLDEMRVLKKRMETMPEEEVKALDQGKMYEALTGYPYNPIWNPLPGPQTQAYYSEADELFYGGAAGGGKSDLLLGLALTKHHRSLILRRVATYLKGLTERLKEVVGKRSGLHFRASGYGGTLYGLREHGSLELNGCENESDKENYQGIARDFFGFDEICHFSRTQFRFITIWNRSVFPDIRCRVVMAGNPPINPEDRWVIEEFAPWLDETYKHPAMPGELRWYTTENDKTIWTDSGDVIIRGKERIKPRSRTFIPALLSDNPILDATDYRSRLQALPEPLRSQFLYGNMNIGEDDHANQCIPTAWVRAAQKRWRDHPYSPEGVPLSQVGVDVARGGKCQTTIAKRTGWWVGPLTVLPGKSTPDGPSVANQVIAQYNGECPLNIDVDGVGAGAYECLVPYFKDKINGIHNGATTEWLDKSGQLHFANVRAASYWNLREQLDPKNGQDVCLPPDPTLLADLCAPRFRVTPRGIVLESKEDLEKPERLGRSPDLGDAVVLSFWQDVKLRFWIA